MIKISNQQLGVALYRAVNGLTGAERHAVIKNFTVWLGRQHKLKQSERIIKAFVKYARQAKGGKEIEIISARILDEKTVNKIKDIFGKNTEAAMSVSPELLGGVKIKTEDKIFDASLIAQINQLKKILY